MILSGKAITLGPGLTVGFDAAGMPTANVAGSDGNGQRPSPEQIQQAVFQAREQALQHATFMTLWLMASNAPSEAGIVAPTPGDLANVRRFRT